jgi:DNA polymerase-3 subunit alpha (Gram-positive type)
MAALEDITKRIVELGKLYGKPVVAAGDVHFLDPRHEGLRTIVQAGQGYKDAENAAPLFFRTTGEMLEEFAFLGEADAHWTVVACPNLIAGQVERIEPIPQGFYPPIIETAESEIIELTWNSAESIYGSPLPEVVQKRIQHELNSITKHDFSVLYLIAHRLVKKSNEDGAGRWVHPLLRQCLG